MIAFSHKPFYSAFCLQQIHNKSDKKKSCVIVKSLTSYNVSQPRNSMAESLKHVSKREQGKITLQAFPVMLFIYSHGNLSLQTLEHWGLI